MVTSEHHRQPQLLSTSEEELRSKLQEYARFVDETLRPELKRRMQVRQDVETELAEYQDLASKLHNMEAKEDSPSYDTTSEEKSNFESLVDLGHQTVYCRAVSSSANSVFVHVGMGFHVEMKIPEAVQFSQQRQDFLRRLLERRMAQEKQVVLHLESSLQILEELAK
jgi:prefoldin subunit 5